MSPLIGRRVRRWACQPDTGTVQAVAWAEGVHPGNQGWRLLVLLDGGVRLESWDVGTSMEVLPDERPEPLP